MSTDHWTHRAPAALRESFTGPFGEPCFTTLDRRWLWRVAGMLTVNAPHGGHLDQLRVDLVQYLHETCEHHWQHFDAEPEEPGYTVAIPEHRQCLWCNTIEWPTEDQDPAVQS